jgi:hypothetical protein
MRRFFEKFAAGIVIFATLFLNASAVLAVDDDDDAQDDVQVDALQCQSDLVLKFDQETEKFTTFLKSHFENSSSDSTLLNTGIARYIQHKDKINEYLAAIYPNYDKESDQNFNDILNQYKVCQQLADVYILRARELLKRKIVTTSSQKKATIITEKYKAINQQMGELNSEINKMFSYYKTFDNKLTGFLGNKCMK